MNVTHLDDMAHLQNIINVARKLKSDSKLGDPITVVQPDADIIKRIKSVFNSSKVVPRPKVTPRPKAKAAVVPPWTKTKKAVAFATFAVVLAIVSHSWDPINSKRIKTSTKSDVKVDVATGLHENQELFDEKTSTKTKEKEKEKKKFGPCEINIRSDIASPQPLLTHPRTSDFYYPLSDGIIHLGAEELIGIHCMRGFRRPLMVVQNSIILKCLKGKQFLIGESEHNFKTFICNDENTASELNTGGNYWSGAHTTEIHFSLDNGQQLNLMRISRNSTRMETKQVRFYMPNAIEARQTGTSSIKFTNLAIGIRIRGQIFN